MGPAEPVVAAAVRPAGLSARQCGSPPLPWTAEACSPIAVETNGGSTKTCVRKLPKTPFKSMLTCFQMKISIQVNV